MCPTACAPQQEKPPQSEAHTRLLGSVPCSLQLEKSPCSNKDPAQLKINQSIKLIFTKRKRWEGGSGWGIHVYPRLIHVNVWQKPLQYCKVIRLQLIKINEKKSYKTLKKKNKKAHESTWRNVWHAPRFHTLRRSIRNTTAVSVEGPWIWFMREPKHAPRQRPELRHSNQCLEVLASSGHQLFPKGFYYFS